MSTLKRVQPKKPAAGRVRGPEVTTVITAPAVEELVKSTPPPIDLSSSNVKYMVEAPAPVHEDAAADSTVSDSTVSNSTVTVVTPPQSVISAARVRRYLDRLGLNKSLNDNIAQIKAGGESPDTIERIAELNRGRIRFSNEASVTLATVCDDIVKQLTTFAMDHALSTDKKIIKVEHLHRDGVKQLQYYPLVFSLPTFAEMTKQLAEKELCCKIEAAVALAEKELKKKYGVSNKSPKKDIPADTDAADTNTTEVVVPKDTVPKGTVPKDAVSTDDMPAEAVDAGDDSPFKFYVGLLCKKIIKDEPKYKSIRVSTELKEYLSALLVEFIQRMAPLIQLITTCMKNKTINDMSVRHTVDFLLLDAKK